MFNSDVDGNKFKGIETTNVGDVDQYTAFLLIVLSDILEGQVKSADHSVLEQSIKMHCARNFECDWWRIYYFFIDIYIYFSTTLLTPEIRIHSKSIATLSNEPNVLCLHK